MSEPWWMPAADWAAAHERWVTMPLTFWLLYRYGVVALVICLVCMLTVSFSTYDRAMESR